MKKFLLIVMSGCLLTGCGSKEKEAFEQVLIEQFEQDSDMKDYNILPEDMAACVIDGIRVPGPPWGDARQAAHYQAYTQLVVMRKQPSIAAEALKNAQTVFGSVKAATAATLSISDNTMRCLTVIVGKGQNTGEKMGE